MLKWTDKEIELLVSYYESNFNISEIAKLLGRTERAIANKAYLLGITNNNSFTKKEIEYIRKNYKNYNLVEISKYLNRPKTSVCRVARNLGIDMNCKKKETVKPKRKFATQEELNLWKSQMMKEWHKTHEHPKGMLGKHHKPEYCEQISKRVKEYWKTVTPEALEKRKTKQRETKIKNGTLNPNENSLNPYSRAKSGKRKDLENIFFRSAWEANIARLLNFKKIKWLYEPKTFYFNNAKVVSYTPDFYLPELDIWIEVKGWFDEKSKQKMLAFKNEYQNEKIVLIGECEYRNIEKVYKNKIINWER